MPWGSNPAGQTSRRKTNHVPAGTSFVVHGDETPHRKAIEPFADRAKEILVVPDGHYYARAAFAYPHHRAERPEDVGFSDNPDHFPLVDHRKPRDLVREHELGGVFQRVVR